MSKKKKRSYEVSVRNQPFETEMGINIRNEGRGKKERKEMRIM
jgi:hypothetical protein